MQNISILGSGWLGFPLARELSVKYSIKLSTTTQKNIERLTYSNIKTYLVNIDNKKDNIARFLDSETLIVNIPSKNIDSFKEFAKKVKNSPIKKVIFISSTSVYKDCNKSVKEDNTECYSSNNLLEIEKLFLEFSNIQTTVLRFGGLIGYDRNLVKYFQEKTVHNSKNRVNMIHRDDCIAIIKKLIKQEIFGDIFNCCATSHPTKEEFYTHCAANSEYKVPKFDNKSSNYKIIDNGKLKTRLNYKYIYDNLLDIKY